MDRAAADGMGCMRMPYLSMPAIMRTKIDEMRGNPVIDL
jgi:hypothetical protein